MFEPNRGGHAPGHLRDAFLAWVNEGDERAEVVVGWAEERKPVAWLIGQLWNCTDIIPGAEFDAVIDMLPGWAREQLRRQTYASVVRALRECAVA